MKRRNFLFVLTLVVCLMLSSVSVCAVEDNTTTTTPVVSETEVATEPDDGDNVENEENSENADEHDTTNNSGLRPGQFPQNFLKPTKPNETTKPSKPSKPSQNQNTNNDGNSNVNAGVNNNTVENREDEEPTTEETLPEGHFYVYLERNNGQKRLKTELSEPSLVPEPEVPVKAGYIFDGWYADKKFTKVWNFFTDIAQEGTIIYAKWVVDPDAVVYKITVEKSTGGYLKVNPSTASAGQPVIINVVPDDGMKLVAGSVTINGKPTDFLNFTMPNGNVVISAEFEKIPAAEKEDEEAVGVLPFVIGGMALLIVAITVVVVVLLGRRKYNDAEIDENGTIIDTDDDKSWVDETIVVEDGFNNGEKHESKIIIPDDDITLSLYDDE